MYVYEGLNIEVNNMCGVVIRYGVINNTCSCVRVCVYVHMCNLYISWQRIISECVSVYVCMHAYTVVNKYFQFPARDHVGICMYVCMYVCMCQSSKMAHLFFEV
jgi:hypothetical protein